jgi:hypothetical protein
MDALSFTAPFTLQIMQVNTSLRTLLIRRVALKSTGAKAIAATLPIHPSLQELDLMDNPEASDVHM